MAPHRDWPFDESFQASAGASKWVIGVRHRDSLAPLANLVFAVDWRRRRQKVGHYDDEKKSITDEN
jgi:hypothetical protein